MNAPIDATLQNLYDWIDKQREVMEETPDEKAMRIFQEWDRKRWQPQIDMLDSIMNKLVRQLIASVDRDGLALTTPEE